MASTSPAIAFLTKLITTSLAIILVAYLLPGVEVESALSAIGIALVLSLLNIFVKPVLIILTLPITVVTLGLFLLVINALLILLAAKIVPGFSVNGFWWAVLFSIILSIVVSVMETLASNATTRY